MTCVGPMLSFASLITEVRRSLRETVEFFLYHALYWFLSVLNESIANQGLFVCVLVTITVSIQTQSL